MEPYTIKLFCNKTDLEYLLGAIGKDGAILKTRKVSSNEKIKAVVKLNRHVITCPLNKFKTHVKKKREEGCRIIDSVINDSDSKLISIIYVKSLGEYDPKIHEEPYNFTQSFPGKKIDKLECVRKLRKRSIDRTRAINMITRKASANSIGSPDERRRESEEDSKLKKCASENGMPVYQKDEEKEIRTFTSCNTAVFGSVAIFRKFYAKQEIEGLKEALNISVAMFKMNPNYSKNWYDLIIDVKEQFFTLIGLCIHFSKEGIDEYYSNNGSRSPDPYIYSVRDRFSLSENHFTLITRFKIETNQILKWIERHKSKKNLPKLIDVILEALGANIIRCQKEINLLLQQGLDIK